MSSFDTSTLMNEVRAIVNSDTDNYAWYYEARVVVGDVYYNAYKLISMDTVRDYRGSYSDRIVVELAMPGGQFVKNILPYKEDIKVQIMRIPRNTQFHGKVRNSLHAMRTYRATIIDNMMPETASSDPSAKLDASAIDLMDLRRVSFQLQDIVMEQLRLITIGTIGRAATPTDIVKALVTQGSALVKTDIENSVKGVSMIEADNTEIQKHLIIPPSTLLVDLPDLVQNDLCGLYSAGLGFYLQNLQWYLWPLYDCKRYDRSLKKLTIILAPKNRFPGLEKTYRVTANQVIILITGGAEHLDDTEAKLLNEGNGIRYADTRRTIEGFGSVKDNRVVAHRSHNANEFVGVPRANGLNNVRTIKATSNIYRETSKLASRKGSAMIANWHNSDPDLIVPSMACQVIFERKGMPVTLDATILGTQTYTYTADGGINTKQHFTNTALSLFVDKDLPEFKEYVAQSNVEQYNRPLESN